MPSPNRSQQVVAVVAIVIIVASLVSIFYRRKPSAPKVDLTPYADYGQVIAEEVAKVLGNDSTVVILDGVPRAGSAGRAQFDAFSQAAQQHGMTISAVETDYGWPLRAKKFRQCLAMHGDASALIWLEGIPVYDLKDLAPIDAFPTKLIVVGCSRATAEALCRYRNVPLVFAYRDSIPSTIPKQPTPRAQFDQVYEIITPATLASPR